MGGFSHGEGDGDLRSRSAVGLLAVLEALFGIGPGGQLGGDELVGLDELAELDLFGNAVADLGSLDGPAN